MVILEKMDDWNVVELSVNEEVVFHCNIKDLEFGNPLPPLFPPPPPAWPSLRALSFQLKGSVCGAQIQPGLPSESHTRPQSPCPVALSERLLSHRQ